MKFVRWRKTHRKKRINKKFKKKYGAIYACDRKCYVIGGYIYCCNCVLQEFKKELREKNGKSF